MDLDNSFYKNICYKKNAYEELSNYLKFYFYNKEILVLIGQSVDEETRTELIDAIKNYKNEVRYIIINKFLTEKQVDIIAEKINENYVIIGQGSGYVAEITKYISSKSKSKYILCPTTPTTSSFFTTYYKFGDLGEMNYKQACLPSKIFISEKALRKCKPQVLKSGLLYMLSFYEVLCSLQFESLIVGEQKMASELKLTLSKLSCFYNEEEFNSPETALLLMDVLIDLSYIIKDKSPNDFAFLNMANGIEKLSQAKNLSFGELAMVSANVLLCAYKKFFSLKRISLLYFPQLDNICKVIGMLNIKKFNKLEKIVKSEKQFDLLKKANDNKAEMLKEVIVSNGLLKRVANKPYLKQNIERQLDGNICLDIIKVLPYISQKNYLLFSMGASGILCD